MVFWGSSIDPAKATKYEVPLIDYILPPPESDHSSHPTPTSSKVHSKPTDHLPEDHGHAPGENTKPAFTSSKLDLEAHPTGTASA